MLKRNPGRWEHLFAACACLFPCGADSRLRDLGAFWIFVNGLARQGDDMLMLQSVGPSRDIVFTGLHTMSTPSEPNAQRPR
jgi:hypothetical protein